MERLVRNELHSSFSLPQKLLWKREKKIMQSRRITFCSAFSGGKMYPSVQNNVAIAMKASANEKHVHCLPFASRFLFSVPQFLWSERLVSPSCQQVEFCPGRQTYIFVFLWHLHLKWQENIHIMFSLLHSLPVFHPFEYMEKIATADWDCNPETFNIVLMCKCWH